MLLSNLRKNNIDDVKVLDYLTSKSLYVCFQRVMASLEPNTIFLNNWYIELLCEALQAFADGKIQKLNINIPPRFAKTLLCNATFSMWMIGNNPTKKIISASYGATLSQKIHNKCRSISNTSWFRRSFPDFIINSATNIKVDEMPTKNTQSQFITSKGGFRIATSVGAAITGDGGDIVIADDLMNPNEALSETQRESSLNWTSSTLFSRFNNRKTGQLLFIAQRLHDRDPTGVFVDDSWVNIIIPVQAQYDINYRIGKYQKTYKKGEWLEPKRYGQKELEEDRFLMGSRNLEAQFFQNPLPSDGDIFKKAWFQYYLFLPKCEYYAIYADTASKEGRENDYTVFMCFGILTKNNRKYAYLIDIYRDKMGTPELVAKAKEFWLKHLNNEQKVPLIKFAIEDKSSGIGLIQILENETNIPIIKLVPEKDKVARANDVTPRFEAGQVLFPKDAPFLPALEKEMLLFSPKKNNNKKDQVDTITYAIRDLLFDDIEERPLDYSGLIKEYYGR